MAIRTLFALCWPERRALPAVQEATHQIFALGSVAQFAASSGTMSVVAKKSEPGKRDNGRLPAPLQALTAPRGAFSQSFSSPALQFTTKTSDALTSPRGVSPQFSSLTAQQRGTLPRPSPAPATQQQRLLPRGSLSPSNTQKQYSCLDATQELSHGNSGRPPPPRGALSPSTAQKSAAPTTAFGLDLLQRAPQSLAHISSPRLDECKISITNKRLGIRKRPSNLTPIEEELPESSHPKKPKKGQSKQPLLRAEPPSLINGLPGGPPTAWTRLREGGDIKIITHNVNGIRARLKDDKKSASNGFLSMLHDQKPDMIFLQEFRCPTADFLAQKDVKEALAKLDYRLLLNNTSTDPNAGYAGVAVLSRIPAISWGGGIDDSSTAFNLDAEGRLLWVNVGGLIIVNVYAPNSGTPV